jgi:hypothetical protein
LLLAARGKMVRYSEKKAIATVSKKSCLLPV